MAKEVLKEAKSFLINREQRELYTVMNINMCAYFGKEHMKTIRVGATKCVLNKNKSVYILLKFLWLDEVKTKKII